MPDQEQTEQKESKERADYDGMWKDAIERFLPRLLERVLPDLYADVDFSIRPEFLENELRDIAQFDNNPAVYVDELIRLILKNGGDAWILLHIEIQGPGGDPISGRMFNYMTLIHAHYHKLPVALAILTSRRPSEVIGEYSVENPYGTKLSYTYNCFEVYAQDDDKMLQSDNPFDLIFYAVKNTSKNSQRKKYALLLKLVKILASKGWSEADRRDLFSFIVRTVNLTDTELQQKFVAEIKMGEDKMAELTFVEKYFKDEGIAEGRAEGIAIGEQRGEQRIRSIYEWLSKSGKFSQEELADMMARSANTAYSLQ